MSDPLLRATKALKGKYDDAAKVSPAREEAARERILEATNVGVRHRRASRMVLLPIAAAFALLATWAAATGALSRVFSVEPATSGVETVPLPGPGLAPAPQVSAGPRLAPSVAAPSAAPTAEEPPPAPPAPRPSAAVTAPASAAPTVSAEEERLYAEAHRAHFEARDYPRALAAWDAYLAGHPAGRLAPEARYNRALCLVRLGRRGEAQTALEAFARGDYGSYRRAESTRLLEALSGDAAP
jgi:TolA-binding protein